VPLLGIPLQAFRAGPGIAGDLLRLAAGLAQDVIGLFEHGLYVGGLRETDILTAPAATDDLATYYTVIPPEHVIDALFTVALTDLGL